MLDQKIDPTPVIVQGLGPMGKEILKAAHQDPRLNVVGVVDIDSSLVGTRLSDHGLEPGNIVISSSLEAGNTADVVLHATGSYLESVAPQIQEALTMGLNVVSTCEELSFPFVRHPSISETLDSLALDHGLTVVGTGVNPGFMMDRLPLAMASISHSIRSIQVDRVQDPTSRRRPFQVKVGMGMSTKEFEELASKGSFGHVGLEESARLIATGLGWDLEKWDHHIEPVHAETAERVNGLIETLKASTADGRTLALRFVAHSSVDECFDSIKIEGLPEIDLHIAGGVAGDDATAAAVLQAAKVIKSARTGLISVLELPLGAYKFRSQEG
tara:strand:+ start:727 stop:1710 length:984 start_codon:yes stop_codon:yes gene_type:complete